MMGFEGLVKLAELYSEAGRNEYMRSYMAKRYHDKMNSIRKELGSKCASCGAVDVPFHLDHIDASKKTMRAADLHSVNDQKVKLEMKNLQLLCGPCHKKKTHEEWDYSTPKPSHGTYWMYRKYDCRCDDCVKAYKDKIKEWRDKNEGKKKNS